MAGLSLGNELSMGQVRRSEFEGTQPNTSVEDEIYRAVGWKYFGGDESSLS